MTPTIRTAMGVGAVYAIVLGAALLSPYDPATQHRDRPLAPPTRVHVVDRDGRVHLRPFVYADDESGPTYPVRFFAHEVDENGSIGSRPRSSSRTSWTIVAGLDIRTVHPRARSPKAQ